MNDEIIKKLKTEFFNLLKESIFDDNFFENLAKLKKFEIIKNELKELPKKPELNFISQEIFDEVNLKIDECIDDIVTILNDNGNDFYHSFEDFLYDVLVM